MQAFFELFIGYCQRWLQLIDSYYMVIYGYRISILSILVAFLITSMIITVYWKGAKG